MTTIAPMLSTVRRMVEEVDGIVQRLCDVLVGFASTKGRSASELRKVVGDLRAKVTTYIQDKVLAEKILGAFTAALATGISMRALDQVLMQLRSETPSEGGALATVQVSIVFALASQCRLIVEVDFVSRDDVVIMQKRMKYSFDLAKEMAADVMDNEVYAAIVNMAAKLARHLADTALPLPQVVQYQLSPMPSVAWAYRIYSDASRAEGLAKDNKIVHPLFMPASVRALSA